MKQGTSMSVSSNTTGLRLSSLTLANNLMGIVHSLNVLNPNLTSTYQSRLGNGTVSSVGRMETSIRSCTSYSISIIER